MNILILYGKQPGWTIDYEKLLNFLKPTFHEVLSFIDTNSLNNYLKNNSNKIYILPLTEPHIYELHEAKIKAIMTTPEVIHIFSNKKNFDKYVSENNLTKYVPKSYSCNDYSGQIVIVKPPTGGSSIGMYLSNINKLPNEIFNTHLIQEYIKEETEFTGNLVVQDGRILFGFAYVRHYGNRYYIKNDSQDFTTQQIAPISQKYLDILELFLLPVKYTGVCNVDFKLSRDTIIVFEINPRLGGSLFFSNHYDDLAKTIIILMNVKFEKEKEKEIDEKEDSNSEKESNHSEKEDSISDKDSNNSD